MQTEQLAFHLWKGIMMASSSPLGEDLHQNHMHHHQQQQPGIIQSNSRSSNISNGRSSNISSSKVAWWTLSSAGNQTVSNVMTCSWHTLKGANGKEADRLKSSPRDAESPPNQARIWICLWIVCWGVKRGHHDLNTSDYHEQQHQI